MAYYYKINDSESAVPLHKGFHLQKVKTFKGSGPKINYDFSKHVLIELLDDTTPEDVLWRELGLINNNNIIHKRMMLDSHRIKCRRAVVICISSHEAKQLAQQLSRTKVMDRRVCAVVIEDLLSDLCLFEKQIIQYGDNRYQHQLLYVSDLSRCRGSVGLVKFLKEKFSPFGSILSVLVCSDDDGYAFPEGVIKFAYLSEAFAAELAFDQYVVGKERLSVTTHHNILLSQCDLRVRLRDAQRYNNSENSNISTESLFKSCNQICEQNDFDIYNEAPVLNSINNLQISQISNNPIVTENNLVDDRSEVSLPAFSQYNFEMNIPMKHHYKDTDHTNKEPANRKIENEMPIPYRNITSDLDTVIIENNDQNCKRSSLNLFNHKMSTCFETNLIDVSTTRSINEINNSSYYVHLNFLNRHETILSHNKNSSKNLSDTDSFITCKNFQESSSNSFFPPLKTTVHKGLKSDEINSASKYETVDCHLLQKFPSDTLNDPKNVKPSLIKGSKKRRKKFLPSQKLCLKSQRTGFSQSDFQSTRSEISVSSSSQPEKPFNRTEQCIKDLSLSYMSSDSSKVSAWLSNIPAPQAMPHPCEQEECMDTIDAIGEKPVQKSKKHNNRISIHRAPSIKSKLITSLDNSWSDNSCVENYDPNKIPVILSDGSQPAPLLEKSKSPLQLWLKQEIMSSSNNRIVKSLETSKSIIVCATRTGDDVISVGCSHMTCDSCYPQSTDLLLGYN